jgi:hypothetical protein
VIEIFEKSSHALTWKHRRQIVCVVKWCRRLLVHFDFAQIPKTSDDDEKKYVL